jgi:hypothetical protein
VDVKEQWEGEQAILHDLRGLLATIRLWEYIARKSDQPEKRARALAAICQCTHAQSKLIDELERIRCSKSAARHAR